MTPDNREVRGTMKEWKNVSMPDDTDNRIRLALRDQLEEENDMGSGGLVRGSISGGLIGDSLINDGSIKQNRRTRKLRRAFTWSSIAAALIVIGIVLTPIPAYAVFQKVFQYIPGFGTLRESPAGSTNILVLQKPIQVKYKGGTVTIVGMMATKQFLSVQLRGQGAGPVQSLEFINGNGKSYNIQTTESGEGKGWESRYSYYGTVQDAGTGTLIIGSNPGKKVSVKLTKANSGKQLSDLGPTDTHNGVTIAAIPIAFDKHAQLTFVSKHSNKYRVSDYVSDYVPSEGQLTVTDSKGKQIKATRLSGFGPPPFSFTPVPRETHYKVTIPAITVNYTKSTKVTLPVPRKGSLDVNKQITLAGLPIVFTKVQWTNESGKSQLQFIAHRVPHGNGSRVLQMFMIRGTSSAHANPKTGTFTLTEPAPHWRRRVTLNLTNINVQINGPWKFNVTIPKQQTDKSRK